MTLVAGSRVSLLLCLKSVVVSPMVGCTTGAAEYFMSKLLLSLYLGVVLVGSSRYLGVYDMELLFQA